MLDLIIYSVPAAYLELKSGGDFEIVMNATLNLIFRYRKYQNNYSPVIASVPNSNYSFRSGDIEKPITTLRTASSPYICTVNILFLTIRGR